jgi:O-succinylbenzoic acid--CoA ligase
LVERALGEGMPALQTYGMTETVGQVATVGPDDVTEALGSAGRPLDGVEVRVVDADGTSLPAGSEGRIEVRGPVVTPGAWGDEERDPSAWLRTRDLGSLDDAGRTRDLGSLDDAGNLTVWGRADEVIVTGGENVHPARVEGVLRRIDSVVDVRVYGEPDDEWGRVVVADIVLDRGHLQGVQAEARRVLPGFMVPKRWRRVDRIDRGWKG